MNYAEDMNYWQTTVHPTTSQGEVLELLEHFGASAIQTMTGQARGRYAWIIRFTWNGQTYRFIFQPLESKYPSKTYSFGGKRRAGADQARYQMGRIAVNFIKALLTSAEIMPDVLFGFLELPGVSGSGLPPTTAELEISGLTAALPEITVQSKFLLSSGEEK